MDRKQNNRDIWTEIIKNFTPHSDYELEDYYCFTLMQLKRNRKWSIKLVYDYVGGNSKTSNAISVDTLDEAVEICSILQDFAKDKSEAPKTVSLASIKQMSKVNNEENW